MKPLTFAIAALLAIFGCSTMAAADPGESGGPGYCGGIRAAGGCIGYYITPQGGCFGFYQEGDCVGYHHGPAGTN